MVRTILSEAAGVAGCAALVGLAVGAVRGLPSAIASEDNAASCAAPVPEAPSVAWTTIPEAHAQLGHGGVWFVDARPHEAFQHGHVSGALSIPAGQAQIRGAFIRQLAAAETIIVYCDTTRSCSASTRVARQLAAAGLSGVQVLEGGFPEWLRKGYAAESGPCRLCPEPSASSHPDPKAL